MIDVTSLQPKPDATLAELLAAAAAINDRDASTTLHRAELTAQRKDLLLGGSMDEIRQCEAALAEADIDLDRLSHIRESIAGRLPAARLADTVRRQDAKTDVANGLLAELNKALGDYPKHAAALAKVAKLSAAHAEAFSEAYGNANRLAMENASVTFALPTPPLQPYHELIKLPGVALPGDDGNDAARKRFWPEQPAEVARLPDPPKVYGPARFTGYTISQPGGQDSN